MKIDLNANERWFIRCAIELRNQILPLSEQQLSKERFLEDYGISQEDMNEVIDDLNNKL